MSTKAKWLNSILQYFESTTQETILPMAPVFFLDDFFGKALDVTNTWATHITGAAPPTVALVASGPNGAVACTLTNANEVQLAGFDTNDQRPFLISKGLIAEFRARFTTLPASATTACLGLCGNHNAAIDTVAESAWFRWDAATAGLITVETDDTNHETSKVTTNVTAAVNVSNIFRIDFSDPTSVKFFIDGQRVAASTTFNMNQVTTLVLQPVCRMDKAAAVANLGVIEVDYVKVWHTR
jgi:hypothetical protein